MTDGEPGRDTWWHRFFDSTYADFALRPDDDALGRTIDFLVETLAVRTGDVVLDQCCGTGRIALPLARRGVRVVGVDITPGYVQQAARAAAAEGLDCRFVRGDAFTFTTDEPCDAALNWFTSFGYDTDDDRNVAMLANARASLRPGGRFALDYQNVPRVLAEFQPAIVDRHVDDDGRELLVLVESRLNFRRGMVESEWTLLHPDGRREQRRVETRMLMPHELVRMLDAAGFVDVELLGSIEGEPFGRRSRRLIAVATRPA